MKTIIFCLICLLPFFGLAQRIDSATISRLSPEKQTGVNNYLSKANSSKKTAIILSSVGGAFLIAGSIATAAAISKDELFDEDEPNYGAANALIIIGGVAALASIPFYVGIHKNRQKARALVYQNNFKLSPYASMSYKRSAGLRLTIRLGK